MVGEKCAMEKPGGGFNLWAYVVVLLWRCVFCRVGAERMCKIAGKPIEQVLKEELLPSHWTMFCRFVASQPHCNRWCCKEWSGVVLHRDGFQQAKHSNAETVEKMNAEVSEVCRGGALMERCFIRHILYRRIPGPSCLGGALPGCNKSLYMRWEDVQTDGFLHTYLAQFHSHLLLELNIWEGKKSGFLLCST